jgi:uncharacterized membrane protein
MAQENVVVVRFTDRGKARQALNALKECNADDRIGLASAAVVERTATGELHTVDEYENLGPSAWQAAR